MLVCKLSGFKYNLKLGLYFTILWILIYLIIHPQFRKITDLKRHDLLNDKDGNSDSFFYRSSNLEAAGAEDLDLAVARSATPGYVNETIDLDRLSNASLGPVINPYPFKILLENPTLCAHPDLFLFIYVHTAPANVGNRQRVRKTYGNTNFYETFGVKLKLMFVLGKAKSEDLNYSLRQEAFDNGDILQESYIDDYHNLTHKGRGAMNWIWNHCNHAKYVLKMDDDEFVNIFLLVQHLKNIYRAGYKENMILCGVWYEMPILREGKWKVEDSVLPAKYNVYPPYCSGQAYMFSIDVAKTLFDTSFYVPFLWVDDVYLTGLVPMRANVTHFSLRHTIEFSQEIAEVKLNSDDWFKVILVPVDRDDIYYRMWDVIVRRSANIAFPVLNHTKPGVFW